MKYSITRRQFIKTTAASAGAVSLPSFMPALVRGADGGVPPSNRITVACIGLGNRGPENMRALLVNPEVRVLAVCDVLETQRTKGKQMVDAHYGNQDCATFNDYRELMQRKDLDAVLICTPDHGHPLIAIEAARQGKHMYCEKPIGWSVRAGQAVRKAVHDSKVVFQFGTQQRSDTKFRLACELVRNCRIGKLQTILVGVPGGRTIPQSPVAPVPAGFDYDLWLGPAQWVPYSYERSRPFANGFSSWYNISDYCIGFIGNWGIHHLDIAQWGNGTDLTGPTEVEGKGTFPTEGMADCALSWQVENRFANGVTMVHMDDATSKKHPLQVGGFGHGVTFLGTEGWVHVRRGYIESKNESLLETKFGPGDVRLIKTDHHQNNFIDAIKGRAPLVSPIDVGVRSDTLCWLDQIAIKLKRKLQWDPTKEQFVNDADANAMLDRPMRSPWKLPT